MITHHQARAIKTGAVILFAPDYHELDEKGIAYDLLKGIVIDNDVRDNGTLHVLMQASGRNAEHVQWIDYRAVAKVYQESIWDLIAPETTRQDLAETFLQSECSQPHPQW